MHESQRKGIPFSTSLQLQKSTSLVSRSPQRNLGRAAFRGRWPLGAMAKAKLGKLGKLDAAHLKEDRTKNDLGKFPINDWQRHSSPVRHMMLDIGVIIRCLGYFRFVENNEGIVHEMFVGIVCIFRNASQA